MAKMQETGAWEKYPVRAADLAGNAQKSLDLLRQTPFTLVSCALLDLAYSVQDVVGMGIARLSGRQEHVTPSHHNPFYLHRAGHQTGM